MAEQTMAAPVISFTKVTLYTGEDGRAHFRDEPLPFSEDNPQVRLTATLDAKIVQFRYSPVGFRGAVHCTKNPLWVFIVSGAMEVGLSDGTSRVFVAGEHFFSADLLPDGATMDPAVHGHWSRQVGNQPLVTMFVKT